jgi:hypothetical protein
MLKMNRGNTRLFRNNVGAYKGREGQWVQFGLMKGSGDLIGWEIIEITPEMVGTKIARFLSVEVKAENGGRVSEAQKNWADRVNESGGRAVVVNNNEKV